MQIFNFERHPVYTAKSRDSWRSGKSEFPEISAGNLLNQVPANNSYLKKQKLVEQLKWKLAETMDE